MADLTVGEIGKVLQLNLVDIDQTQSPPASIPLDLTNAQSVFLFWSITAIAAPPTPPGSPRSMSIVGPAVNGVVSYAFLAGDLAAPPGMGKTGQFRFSVKVLFTNSNVLYPAYDGLLSIKDDSIL
jgi:hypothetical protein